MSFTLQFTGDTILITQTYQLPLHSTHDILNGSTSTVVSVLSFVGAKRRTAWTLVLLSVPTSYMV